MSKDEISNEIAYQAMMHFINYYFREVGFNEEDVLSWGAYKKRSDEPRDMAYKYKWDELIEKVKNGELLPIREDE
ncbi:MAG: hypothetical protein ACWA41_10840 [Putridiphycobacter sp.]